MVSLIVAALLTIVSTILDLMVVLFLIAAVFLLFLFIHSDILQSKRYKTSKIARGEIVERKGKQWVRYYGWYGLRLYGEYLVRFLIDGTEQTGLVLLKNRKLNPGEWVEVHYVIEEGQLEVLNDIVYRRWKEFKLSFCIAVPFCTMLIYLKLQGII